jgi:hypothetical protein
VDSGRILATLIRLLGDFDLAEEAMHEALSARCLSGEINAEQVLTREHGGEVSSERLRNLDD